MKKFLKTLTIAALAIASLSLPAFAQRSSDLYGAPRTISLGVQNFNGATGLLITNGPIDVRMLDGIAAVTLFSITNTATTGGTCTATIYGSQDQTNLTAVTYALSTSTSVSYTNYWYDTNGLKATDVYLLPGTVTTPASSSAGFATPYFVSAPFTNTAAITLSAKGINQVGISIGDAPRYLYIVYTAAGTQTNFTVGAAIAAATHSGQLY